MTRIGMLAAPLALLLFTGTAMGQTSAIFKAPPAPDPTKPLTAEIAAPPTGIPGFYDSATQTFTPMESAQPASSDRAGDIAAIIGFVFGGIPLDLDDTFLIALFYGFGALEPTTSQSVSFFKNSQTLSASTNFGYAGQKSMNISTNFVTQHPQFQPVVTCQVNHGNYVILTHVYLPTQTTKSGTTNLRATCNL